MQSCATSLLSKSPDDTARFAQNLGRILTSPSVICLEGPVGSGKTHFARALIQSLLTTPEDVPSPTFTLVQVYETSKGAIWHTDLYRIASEAEIEELGLLEAFTDSMCLVEWPDRLGELIPKEALTIALSAADDPDHRHLSFSSDASSQWSGVLESMAND